MSGKKMFVGNLPWRFTSEDLENLFDPYGPVMSAKVIVDRETGRSRGFGFVELEDGQQIEEAIRELNGKDVDGRGLRVAEAQERERSEGGRQPRFRD